MHKKSRPLACHGFQSNEKGNRTRSLSLQIRFPISTFLNSFRHLINLFQRRMSITASMENIFRSWFPLLLKSTGLKFLPSLRSIRSLTFKFLVTEFNKNRHIFIILLRKQENQILTSRIKIQFHQQS